MLARARCFSGSFFLAALCVGQRAAAQSQAPPNPMDGVDFEPGLNTATHKHYIDFCSKHGIEYHTLDGTDTAWYGGPIVPTGPTDVTTSVP